MCLTFSCNNTIDNNYILKLVTLQGLLLLLILEYSFLAIHLTEQPNIWMQYFCMWQSIYFPLNLNQFVLLCLSMTYSRGVGGWGRGGGGGGLAWAPLPVVLSITLVFFLVTPFRVLTKHHQVFRLGAAAAAALLSHLWEFQRKSVNISCVIVGFYFDSATDTKHSLSMRPLRSRATTVEKQDVHGTGSIKFYLKIQNSCWLYSLE